MRQRDLSGWLSGYLDCAGVSIRRPGRNGAECARHRTLVGILPLPVYNPRDFRALLCSFVI
jgi:hypothetical protein